MLWLFATHTSRLIAVKGDPCADADPVEFLIFAVVALTIGAVGAFIKWAIGE